MSIFLIAVNPGTAVAATRAITLPNGITARVYESLWPTIPIELQYQTDNYKGTSALLVTHNEKVWDIRLVARKNAEISINNAFQKKMPVVGLLYPSQNSVAFLENQTFDPEELVSGLTRNNSFLFSGDFHLVRFEVDDLYMTGGALSRCFCQSLRSVLAHSKVKRIHFVLPAMYGIFPEYWQLRGRYKPFGVFSMTVDEGLGVEPQALLELKQNFSSQNLADALKTVSDSDLVQFFRYGLFGDSKLGLPYCDGNSFLEQSTRSYTINLYRGPKKIGSFGSGSEQVDVILEFEVLQ